MAHTGVERSMSPPNDSWAESASDICRISLRSIQHSNGTIKDDGMNCDRVGIITLPLVRSFKASRVDCSDDFQLVVHRLTRNNMFTSLSRWLSKTISRNCFCCIDCGPTQRLPASVVLVPITSHLCAPICYWLRIVCAHCFNDSTSLK